MTNFATKIVFIILTLLQFIFCSTKLVAQDPYFETFSTDNGLPSSEVYFVLQDSTGYLWVSTDKGVARYDGYQFTTYTVDNGLSDNSTVYMYLDRKKRVWFASYEGGLSYWEHDSIKQFPLNKELIKLSLGNYISHLYLDNKDQLWLSSSYNKIFVADSKFKTIKRSPIFDKDRKENTVAYQIFNDGFLIDRLTLKPDTINTKKTTITNIDNTFYLRASSKMYTPSKRYNLEKKTDSEHFICYNKHLFQIKNKQIIKEIIYSSDVSGITYDSQNNLWVSVCFDGIYIYKDGDLSSIPTHILSGKTFGKVFEDKYGDYWLPCSDIGLLALRSIIFKSYNVSNAINNVISFAFDGNLLYYGTANNELFKGKVNNGKISVIKELILKEKIHSLFKRIIVNDDHSLWLTKTHSLHFDTCGNPIDTQSEMIPEDIIKLDDGRIAGVNADGFSIFKDGKLDTFHISKKINHSYCLYEDYHKTIWIGAFNGLFFYKDNQFNAYDTTNKYLHKRITVIKGFEQDIWVGTYHYGVNLIRGKNILRFSIANGLSSNFISDIFVENKNEIWITTNKGLNKIQFTDKERTKFIISIFDHDDGLPTNELNCIVKRDGIYYLGTKAGIVTFDTIIAEPSHTDIPLIIEKVRANGRDIIAKDYYHFNADENDITFFYKFINLKYRNRFQYHVQLTGAYNFDDTIPEPFYRFSSLSSGDYKLCITVLNQKKETINKPIYVSFSIEKPYYKKVWFIGNSFLLTGVILWILFRYILRKKRKKLKNKELLLTIQKKALRAQLNSHFIFNALNAIQLYILRNQNHEAQIYLAKFSDLLGRVLENIKHDYISLYDIIPSIELYIELEKLRLTNNLEYEIDIDPNIDLSSFYIPPMILEPFIENAIWERLSCKKSDRKLDVSIVAISENVIKCIIQDNGEIRVEFDRSKYKLEKNDADPFREINERIETLNDLTQKQISFTTSNINDDAGNFTGTIIEIIIPSFI